MHREGVLFKHLQLALDPVLRADCFARPHILLHRGDCHSRNTVEPSVISLSFKNLAYIKQVASLHLNPQGFQFVAQVFLHVFCHQESALHALVYEKPVVFLRRLLPDSI